MLTILTPDENDAQTQSIGAEHVGHLTPNPETNEELEDFLDRVCAPMVGVVPYAERAEIKSTIRDRLNQAAAAHRELGSSENEAFELAIAQLGDPERFGRRFIPQDVQSYERRSLKRSRTTLADRWLGSAKRSTYIASLALGVPLAALYAQVWLDANNTDSTSSESTVRLCLFALPLLAGIVTGLAAKQKPVRGVVNAIGLLVLLGVALPGIGLCLDVTEIYPNPANGFGLALSGVIVLAPWLLFGCLGAALGLRLQKSGARIATRARRVLRSLPRSRVP